LINEYRQVRGLRLVEYLEISSCEMSAFIRSIQLHEKTKKELADFKQEVSDAVKELAEFAKDNPVRLAEYLAIRFSTLIGPKPKPDPLEKAIRNLDWLDEYDAERIRIELDALGFEIREKGQ
jgi:hypothetical protein